MPLSGAGLRVLITSQSAIRRARRHPRIWSAGTASDISRVANYFLAFLADPPPIHHYCEKSATEFENSHQNGGRVFLIFVANPRTVRLFRNFSRDDRDTGRGRSDASLGMLMPT
jgi:hypothetical protein